MRRGLLKYLVRRLGLAALLVAVVSSAALLLVQASPGDHLSSFELDPAAAAAERHRLGLDRPIAVQYADWLGRALRLDFGESVRYRRPVNGLIAERAGKTALLGVSALLLATLVGIPAGIVTGSRRNALTAFARGVSLLLVSVPSLVTSFALLLLAARTGWFPVGGFAAEAGASWPTMIRYLAVPAVALALPIAATLERLQSQAMQDALLNPSVRAALARGCSSGRVIWRHAFRLALPAVLGIYGVIVGTVLSGSFAVEVVTSWPGLGALMYEGLVSRDLFLVAGCAAAGAFFLALGTFAADIALAFADPRFEESEA
ncbi:MAG TPA: ABC transporter permease [Vicinamibacterales bacterium]|nr:ABC transporter permease [Vicinamibacterales bacterium]